MAASEELLTEDEKAAMELTATLFNTLCRIVGQGRSRDGDLREIAGHIHNIQHMIMSQAAARAYPERYRLLGGELVIATPPLTLREDPYSAGPIRHPVRPTNAGGR